MASGIEVLKPFEEGDRCQTEDGAGEIQSIITLGSNHICRVRLDSGGEAEYELETLAEEIDANRTCKAFGLCDGEVIGKRRSPGETFSEPICARHNRIADERNWPGELEPYRDPRRDPTA
jgi:hypothetical protein